MDAFSNAGAEIRHGICHCDEMFGRDVLMAVDPKTVCMVGGPGTDICLIGRCFEVVSGGYVDAEGKLRQPDSIVSIDFYVEGSDERTEECRRQLAEFQASHIKAG